MYVRPATAETARAEPRRAPLWHRAVAFLLKAALPVLLLLGAAKLAQEIYTSAPVAERSAGERQARLVTVGRAAAAEAGPVIRGYGTVEPVRRLVLRPEVGGRVERLSPALVKGGRVAEGEVLLALDDREARLAVAEAEAEIARIRSQIRIEEGQQRRAQSDLERNPIRRDITEEQRALILREPQMQELTATLEAARARRDAAELRVEKSVLTAPFDAVVESEEIAPGAIVMAGSEVARLVAAEAFRVELAVPPASLPWLRQEGVRVVFSNPGVWPEGATREGRIARIGTELTETGRMARVFVEIPDPLAEDAADGSPPLLLGSLLEARIETPRIGGAVAIPRAWLREGGTVWVATPDDRLEVREVEIAWRGRERVLVTGGLAPGERIVTGLLPDMADGMAIRIAGGEAGE